MKLDPRAIAVTEAYFRIGLYNEPCFKTDLRALSAAIHAAVDQIKTDEASAVQILTDIANHIQEISDDDE